MEDYVEEKEEVVDEEDSVFPIKTAFTVLFLVIALGGGFFLYITQKMGTHPNVECTYRGGVWDAQEKQCIFEDTQKDKVQRVGMRLDEIFFVIPDTDTRVSFKDIEIGKASGQVETFVSPQGNGTIALLDEFARVHPKSKDLVVPFAIETGGTGMFLYVALLKETEEGYVHADSVFVGDRIAIEGLSLQKLESPELVDAYSARVQYRDRREGEAMSAVPTEPRTADLTIFNHAFERVFVTSRDGLHYKNMLKVAIVAPYTTITSPLTLSGFARGTWFFEGSFPVSIVDFDGKIIGEGSVTTDEEWMIASSEVTTSSKVTEAFVPFKGTVSFTVPTDIPYRRGAIILRKDNPSGLPENDDAFEIPVVFK